MRFSVIFLVLLFSLPANGKVFKMSDLNFYRYAQPQLKNLTAEFFLVLKKLNENHASFIFLQKSLTTHIHQLEKCKDLNYCAAIDRITRDLNIFEKELWQIQNNLAELSLKNNSEYDKVSKSSIHTQEMLAKVYHLKAKLDIFLALNKIEKSSQVQFQLLQQLKVLELMAQDGSTSLVPSNYQDDFNFINENFIRVIQKHVVLGNDKKFLLGRFRELDNNWNSFHLKVDREVQNFPKETLQIVKIMHRRWNSVLKIILRR